MGINLTDHFIVTGCLFYNWIHIQGYPPSKNSKILSTLRQNIELLHYMKHSIVSANRSKYFHLVYIEPK